MDFPYSEGAGTISTHALREEGDLLDLLSKMSDEISTHALREEGDRTGAAGTDGAAGFLPTPSARRATR